MDNVDLDFYSITFNCLQVPLGKLLKRGFSTGHGFLRPPTSILSASALACIALQSSQNDMYGGQSFPTFEYDLAPYVAKTFAKKLIEVLEIESENEINHAIIKQFIDELYEKHNTVLSEECKHLIGQYVSKLTKNVDYAVKKAVKLTDRETYQAMEAFVHNLNTMQCLPEDQKIIVLNLDTAVNLRDLSDIEKQALKKLLIQLYETMTIPEIANELKTSKNVIGKVFELLDIKPRDKKETAYFMEQRYTELYGVKNTSCLPEIKAKVKKTQFKKYGCYAFNSEKQKQTCIERYGHSNPLSNSKIKEKLKQNNIKKYGVPCTLQYKDTIEKSKKTCIEKYGVFPYPVFLHSTKHSKAETEIATFIETNYPDITVECNVKGLMQEIPNKEVDIWLPELRIGIEYNGIYFHDKDAYMYDLKYGTITTRERIKDMCALTNNFQLIQIWEDDYINDKPLINAKLLNIINEAIYNE